MRGALLLSRGVGKRRVVAAASTPAVDAASQSSNGATTTTLAWTHTVGAALPNSMLLVAVGSSASGSNPAVSGITCGASSLTHMGSFPVVSQLGGLERFLDVWYVLAPPAAASTVTVTMSAAQFIAGTAVSFRDVSQSSPFGAPATQSSVSTNAPSVTTTGGVATDVVFAAVSARTTVAPTPGGGQTQRGNPLAGTNVYLVASTQAGGSGSIASSFSWTTADNSAMAAFAIHGA